MNAVGYIRISTEDQSKYSLGSQERMIREYCERNKLDLVAFFKDDGECSYTFDRPNYAALESFIKEKKDVRFLIVYDHSRFSRNLAEALMKIVELQKKYKINVLTVSESIDTDFNDPTTFMLRAFQLMMAEGELHNIRRKTREGMIGAAEEGRHPNKAPYGYKNERDQWEKCVLVIDEIKADIIRAIFKMFLSGMEIKQVGQRAREMGYKQKSNSAIRRVLSNPIYAGLIQVPPHKHRKHRFVKGIHVPLILEQDYWIIQERLAGKTFTIQKREEVPLRGVLRCWCGRKVTAGNSKSHTGKYHWYYLCPEHRQNMAARKLHDHFDEILDRLSVSKERIGWIREKIADDIGKRLHDAGDDILKLKREIRAVELQIQTTERKYLLNPQVSEETFGQVMTELRADLSRFQRDLAGFNTDQALYWNRLNDLLPKLCHLKDEYEKMDLDKKQQFINLGFDNNLWYENGIYRTHKIHPLFSDKELILKENGLLLVEKPIPKIGESITSTRDGSRIEPASLEDLAKFLELIA